MPERTYPYVGWVLQPSFKPKKVQFIAPYSSYSNTDYGDVTESGRCYACGEIFATKSDAVAAGWKRVDAQKAKLDTMLATLQKKRDALTKAALV